MKFTALGTSTPYPRPDNPCSGYLLQHESTSIWVDAGTGTFAELQRHIPIDAIDGIWISHAHADHTADLLTAYYGLRVADVTLEYPIPLFCPPGLSDRLVAFLGPQAVRGLPKVFAVHELKGWSETRLGSLDLSWGPVDHGMPAFALRATDGEQTLAYSGDTAQCQSLVELAMGADALVCEVGYSVTPSIGAVAHCTPEDAGRLAREAAVARLVLTHLDGGLEPAEAAARAATAYDGTILIARPGQELLTALSGA